MATRRLRLDRLEECHLDRELFIRRFVAQAVDVVRFVKKMENSYVLSDEERHGLKLAEIRARKHGEQALLQEEKELLDRRITVDQLKRRLQELKKPSTFLPKCSMLLMF